ncbi:hypothetical protein [Streptomyces sp. NPDC058739]|uniref:hypothetical protein n=1 Tax=Streptomyces sp. NPDC058739 TaxID=3346618 RepID=UPI00369BECFE
MALGVPAAHPGIERAVITQHIGSRVSPAGQSTRGDRLAHWVALGDNAETCDLRLDQAAKTLVVDIRPHTAAARTDSTSRVPPPSSAATCGASDSSALGSANWAPLDRRVPPSRSAGPTESAESGHATVPAVPSEQAPQDDSPRYPGIDAAVAPVASLEGLTAEDLNAVRGLMDELVKTCASIGSRYCASDTGLSLSPGSGGQFSEVSEVLEELSRRLNRTRSGIRKIYARAYRMRSAKSLAHPHQPAQRTGSP